MKWCIKRDGKDIIHHLLDHDGKQTGYTVEKQGGAYVSTNTLGRSLARSEKCADAKAICERCWTWEHRPLQRIAMRTGKRWVTFPEFKELCRTQLSDASAKAVLKELDVAIARVKALGIDNEEGGEFAAWPEFTADHLEFGMNNVAELY